MRKYISDILNLRVNADFAKTKKTISQGISLRGYNLWILVCSTILASIGLDTNSAAVIIGAMLISPLMSPILGVGLSVAIHEKQLLTRSLANLGVAVVISLGASIIYFFLSPLGEPTTELQARTFPTLLDVLVALFGGLAGIVSISRHEQTNAIPGVAIATALMPPLCTAGFGIATANWNYFFGAFYLFFINAIFISFATYLIVRYLHFPEKEFVNTKVARQYRQWFIILSMIALTPSIYFLYTVYKKEVIKKDIEELVLSPILKQGNEILKWEVIERDTSELIKVYHSGRQLSDTLKKAIDSTLAKHKMKAYHLISMRVNLTKEEVNELSAEMTKQMFQEMHLREIKLQDTLPPIVADTISYHQIFNEVKIAFPFIDTVINGWIMLPNTRQSVDTIPAVVYSTLRPVSRTQTDQFYNFLLARLAADTVALIKK
ncbi:MAG: TIGR00341 family protein [Ginsengibacter sp.]